MDIASLTKLLSAKRFSVHNEKALQSEIEQAFLQSAVLYTREVKLDKANVIDFMVGKVGIEVKIKGSKPAIYRQLERYAEFESVGVILLITALAIHLPQKINNKPVFILKLGNAWL